MTEQEKKLQEFKVLSADEKKKKLLSIFEFAKDKFDFSESAVNYLNSDDSPAELVMENFYEFVISATFLAKERTEKEELQKNEQRKNWYNKEESKALEDEEDANTLLDLINFI